MLLVVGVVGRPHGVRGEVLVDVRTDAPDQRFSAGSVLVTDPPEAGPLTVEAARPHTAGGRHRLIVGFEDVLDRTAAERLRGVRLQVDSSAAAPPDDPDEFNDHDLIGLMAVDQSGARLGEIVGVEHAPASDLLVLGRPDGRRALVPFVRQIVPQVDVGQGRVVLTPPDGLLDL